MARTRALGLFLVLASCASCASPRPPSAPSAEGPLVRSSIAVFGRAIEIDAIEPPSVTNGASDAGRTLIAARVARFAVVACSVTRTRVDPGVTLAPLVTRLADAAPSVEVSLAGDGGPILTLESAPGEARPFVAAVASRGSGTVFCAIDEAGHRARFDRVVAQVARALGPEPTALFRDVRVVHALGKVSGFEAREVVENGDGRIARERTTLLVAKDALHWRIVDATRTTALDADARVVRSSETLSADGRVLAEHAIARTRQGEYALEITGEFPRTATLRSDRLSTELGMAPRVRAVGAEPLRFDEWDSSAFALRSVVVRREADRVVVARGDERASTCAADALGLCVDRGVDRLHADGVP
jgi:hypothetical protein